MRGYNAPMTNIRDYILDGTPEDVVVRYESLPELAAKSDFGVLDSNVVVVDTETTGFSFTHDELIQIAAAKLEDGAIVDWYVTFVNPGKPLPEEIVHLTDITTKHKRRRKHTPKRKLRFIIYIITSYRANIAFSIHADCKHIYIIKTPCRGICEVINLA